MLTIAATLEQTTTIKSIPHTFAVVFFGFRKAKKNLKKGKQKPDKLKRSASE